MTTKTLSTTITAGYSLGPQYSELDITSTGAIDGYGLKLNNAATVRNDGAIFSTTSNGVTAGDGATIVNGAPNSRFAGITGYSGVFATGAPAVVENYASIRGRGQYGDGVFLTAGGSVTNGGAMDTSAYIYGRFNGVAASTGQVANFGTIKAGAANGVDLATGGSLTNGSATDFRAKISGASGVVVEAGTGTIVNDRSIVGYGATGYGVRLGGGGLVTNGAANDTTAKLYGRYGGVASQALATLINFGSVTGHYQDGLFLSTGGAVTNGSAADGRALIEGGAGGVDAARGVATVDNFGTILSSTSGDGVYLSGGSVTNGSTAATGALIEGARFGVSAGTANITLNNFGVINGLGTETQAGIGVSLKAGGTVTNGSSADTAALIEGEGFGIYSAGLAKISNFGTIAAFNGLYLSGGASLTNGSAKDTAAVVDAYKAVTIRDGVGTVANFGTIISSGTGSAVALFNQGVVTNGSAKDTGALIEGGDLGVVIGGMAGTVNNFGTIVADLTANGAAVYLNGGSVTNGSAADAVATLYGRYGVLIGAGAPTTITNFGTLSGFGGVALQFQYAGNTLNVEAGSVFDGQVLGGGSLLNLASGVGTLAGLDATGDVTVSGSMAKTTFQAFGVLEVGAGAAFTDKGAASVGVGHTILTAGTLTLAGAVKNAGVLAVIGGTLTVDGAVSMAGTVSLNGGTATFAATFQQDVTFNAAGGRLELGQSQAFAGQIIGFAAALASLDLDDIAFGGATKATYKGTATSGTLTVVDGTHTAKIALAGDYRHATFIVAADGHGGTLVTEAAKAQSAALVTPPQRVGHADPCAFIDAMAALATRRGRGEDSAPEPVWRTAAPLLAAPRIAAG